MNKKSILIILIIISILLISGCQITLPKIKTPQPKCCEILNLDSSTESCIKNINEVDCSSTYIGKDGYNYYNQDCSEVNSCYNKIGCVYNGTKYNEGFTACSEDKLYQCNNGMFKILNETGCCYDSDNGLNFYKKGSTIGYTSSHKLSIFNDTCYNITSDRIFLREMYCYKNDSIAIESFICPYKCSNGVCIEPPYTITFGGSDPSFFKPRLYDETFDVPINCRKDGGDYSCEDDTIGSKIIKAYAYIKTPINGVIIQRFNLTNATQNGDAFKGIFDYDSLTNEFYELGIYAEDINGIKGEKPNYTLFSGQGWNLCYNDSDCDQYEMQHHSCINNKCILNTFNYKLGLVYLYNTNDTYNPNWRTEFEEINQKVINGIKNSTNHKVNPTIDILGEVQTDIYCWNPADLGIKCLNDQDEWIDYRLPGSTFSNNAMNIHCKDIQVNCERCNTTLVKEGTPFNEYWISIACSSPLISDNLWSDKLNLLNQQISQELSFNFSDYDGVYIIFGNLGNVIPEDNTTIKYRCSTFEGIIGGYSNLFMAENAVKVGGLIPCNEIRNGAIPFYDLMGWQKMVHEILHRFGTVDVYDTGLVFGYDLPSFYRRRAFLIDDNTNKSIMGDGIKDCTEDGYEKNGVLCTKEELDAIYLDKYNKQKVGLP